MKALLINGSHNTKGCTFTALAEMKKVFEQEGIDAEIISIAMEDKAFLSCELKEGIVEEVLEKAKKADCFVFGSPVHYAAPSGLITLFMDKLFIAGGKHLAFKPASAVVSCRRGGASAAFEQINKYFTINNMPVVSSNYWNMVHGNSPDEVYKDEEGIQTVQGLARNMAWLVKCIELGKNNNIPVPEPEAKIKTNYIR